MRWQTMQVAAADRRVARAQGLNRPSLRGPGPVRWRHWLCCTLLCLQTTTAVSAAEVRYPREDGGSSYALELLQLALQKAGARHTVALTPIRMMQDRALFEIGLDRGKVDIMATMTSKERESKLLPIRIPITKGLIGWRVAVVTADRLHQFDRVETLADLKRFRAVQGHDWPDLAILRHNGLATHSVSSHESLFNTLATGRVDYLPLSLLEAQAAIKGREGLAIDQHIVLHYPAAIYFFVNPRNGALAEEVRRGLEASIADGTFDKLYYHHFAAAIKQARLSERRLIELDNPFLPDATPLERKQLWFKFDEVTRKKLDQASGAGLNPGSSQPGQLKRQ